MGDKGDYAVNKTWFFFAFELFLHWSRSEFVHMCFSPAVCDILSSLFAKWSGSSLRLRRIYEISYYICRSGAGKTVNLGPRVISATAVTEFRHEQQIMDFGKLMTICRVWSGLWSCCSLERSSYRRQHLSIVKQASVWLLAAVVGVLPGVWQRALWLRSRLNCTPTRLCSRRVENGARLMYRGSLSRRPAGSTRQQAHRRREISTSCPRLQRLRLAGPLMPSVRHDVLISIFALHVWHLHTAYRAVFRKNIGLALE